MRGVRGAVGVFALLAACGGGVGATSPSSLPESAAPIPETCAVRLPARDPASTSAPAAAPPAAFASLRSTLVVHAEIPLAGIRQALELKVPRRVAEERDHDLGAAGRLEYTVDRGPFTVRVDKEQNVWMVDEGSNMIVKYRPDASVAMVLGRKEEPLDWLEKFAEEGDHLEATPPARNGVFNRPTDVTWDNDGNIFVTDGYNNSRLAKFTKDGAWVGAIGERGSAPNQFNTPHGITNDAAGNIYVADRGNRRVQVYDPALKPLRIIEGMGAPWTVCTSPGPTQYLFSGDGNGKIYKMSLDGKLLGWGQTGLGHGQSGCLVHELHCESETVLYKGDCSTWTVEKITIAQ